MNMDLPDRRRIAGLTSTIMMVVTIMTIMTIMTIITGALARPAYAEETDHDLYLAALARERAVRSTLSSTQAPPETLGEVHAVVAAYRAIVRRYPASGYSDNALWQAGRLSLDAFTRFGEVRDNEAGVRLLRRLVAAYPTSKLVKRVPAVIDAFDRPAAVGGTSGADSSTASPSTPSTPSTLSALSASSAPSATRATEGPAATSTPIATTNTGAIATIRGVHRTVLPDAVRIVIDLDAEVTFHEERITGPDRIFVDLAPARAAPALLDQTLRFNADSDVVRQVRLGRHENRTTRVVLDANGVGTYGIYALYDPYRLVIDCVRGTPPEPAPALLASRRLAPMWGRRLPTAVRHNAVAIHDAVASMPPVTPDPTAVEGPPATAGDLRSPGLPALHAPAISPGARPAKNSNGGFSIARQLGLGVSRIVIDPGHGGHDPGAMGKGVTEAELVLDLALRLEKLLQKLGGVEVVLTRRTDDFVPLPERTAIANREGADLFLSIHANASESGQARGIETYFLNFANNLSGAAVAARENAASGQLMGALPDFVKAIALNNKLDESRDFASFVQRSMVERLRTANKGLKDLGVKQAPFVVLIGAAMPSVLTEVSFVTNAQDAKLLRSSGYRQRIAEALLNAVRKYQSSLKSVATVAQQSR